MTPAPLWRRVAAFALDMGPPLILLDALTGLSDAALLAVCGFALLLGSLALRGQTPGKRLTGLRLDGAGCLPCRELRRLWPVLALGLFATCLEVAAQTGWVAPASVVAFGALAIALGTLWTHLWPLMRGRDFPHDTATGFRVVMSKSE